MREMIFKETQLCFREGKKPTGIESLPFAEVLRLDIVQPVFPLLFFVQFRGFGVGQIQTLGGFDHFFFDINRWLGSKGQGDCVAGARIDGDGVAPIDKRDHRVERIVFQIADENMVDFGLP